MRIRRLTVKNFGKFENYAVDFNGNLAVINGQNEAGKSTVFDMIKVLLFGMAEDATESERMSYVRYGASEAHISGEFERADGSPLTLSRIISKNSCDLNVNENFDFKNMGNVKAPIVSDLSKEVYENIYALDFHAMSAIKDDIWQGIRDEFMGADMAKELVSANDAIENANVYAEELYKNENTPSVINELLKERETLKERLDEVNQSQKDAAQNYLDLDKTKREITDTQNKIEFERAFLQEADKMNGIKDDIARIKTLANDAGDLSAYKKWLPNIKEEYVALKQIKEDAEDALKKARETVPSQIQPIAEKPTMPSKYVNVLEREGDIRALRIEEKVEPVSVQPVKTNNDAEEEYIKATERWTELNNNILHNDLSQEEIFKSLDQINTMSVAEKLEIYSQSKENLDNIIKESTQPKKSGVRTTFFIISLVVSILMIISGAFLFVNEFVDIDGLLSGIPALQKASSSFISFFDIIPLQKMMIGNLLCGVGLILLIVSFAFIKDKSESAQLKSREEIVRQARDESEFNRVEFEKQLFGLPVAKLKIKKADTSITEDIISLKEARQKLFETKSLYENEPQNIDENIEDEVNEIEDVSNEAIVTLAEQLLETPYDSDIDNLGALNALLDEALQYKAQVDTGEPEVSYEEDVPEVDTTELELKYQKANADLVEIEDVLGEDSLVEAENVQERYDKLNRAVVLRDEILEKHPNFKEISERLSHLNKSGWPYTQEAITKAKERIEEMREEIGKAQNKIGVMENSVKKALLGHNPSDIASQILKLDDKIIDSKMEYDKLRISEHIIKEGNDTFSKLHQPEVLQRASYYLSILTDGKYSELDLDGETSEITVLTQNGEYMTPQGARLSQATREQIYLSIRLSVIESFDEEKEVMPITLDEALITWDKSRLTAGLDLLAQIARKRQILIFTCHDFIVDTMKENQPTAQFIELS